MTSVSIPASVQNIDAAFFQLFPNATAVNVAPENPNYKSYNGMLFNADLTNLLLVPEGMEGVAVLPDSLATVPACLFSRCNKLSAIQGSAGNDTFTTRDGILYTKDKTTLVAAPAGLGLSATIAPECTAIAEGAFAGNFWLDTVVANANAMDISPVAFEVKAVENATVVLPAVNSEEEVAEGEGTEADTMAAARASWEAAGFTKFAEGAKAGDTIAPAEGSGFTFDVMENNKLAVRWQGKDPAPANLQIPLYGEIDGVRYDVAAIADEGFAGQTEIKRVDLPSTIQTIGAKAFADATALHTISIPGNVTSIGDNAFTNCQSLVALTLNEGLRSIGNGAFSGISQATVVLPASVKSVGDYAFANSPNLKNIVALGHVSVVSTSALMGISGASVYVPYNEQGLYAWHMGSPAQANHLYPYGVKTQDETINVEVGGKANLFGDGGYLEAPGEIEVNYAYKAKPVSISEDGTVEGKAEGTTNVEVSLRLKVAKTVVPAPVSQETRLVPASFGEDAESTEVEEVIELNADNALVAAYAAEETSEDDGKFRLYSTIECTIDGQKVNSETPYIAEGITGWKTYSNASDTSIKDIFLFSYTGNHVNIKPEIPGAQFAGFSTTNSSSDILPETYNSEDQRLESEFQWSKTAWMIWDTFPIKIYSTMECEINGQKVNTTTPYVPENLYDTTFWVTITESDKSKHISAHGSDGGYRSFNVPTIEGATFKGIGSSPNEVISETHNSSLNRDESSAIWTDVAWLIWDRFNLKVYSNIECEIDGQKVNSTTPYTSSYMQDIGWWCSITESDGSKSLALGVSGGFHGFQPPAVSGATFEGFGLTPDELIPETYDSQYNRYTSTNIWTDVVWLIWDSFPIKFYSTVEFEIDGQTVNSTTPYTPSNLGDITYWITVTESNGDKRVIGHKNSTNTSFAGFTVPTIEQAKFKGFSLESNGKIIEEYNKGLDRLESNAQFGNVVWLIWDNFPVKVYSTIECTVNGQKINSTTPYVMNGLYWWITTNDNKNRTITGYKGDGKFEAVYKPTVTGATFKGFGLDKSNVLSETWNSSQNRYESALQTSQEVWLIWSSFPVKIYSTVECTIDSQKVNSTTPYVMEDIVWWLTINNDSGSRNITGRTSQETWNVVYKPSVTGATFKGFGLDKNTVIKEDIRSDADKRYQSATQYGQEVWLLWDSFPLKIYSTVECTINNQKVNATTPYVYKDLIQWVATTYSATDSRIEGFVKANNTWANAVPVPKVTGATFKGFGTNANTSLNLPWRESENRYRSDYQKDLHEVWLLWDINKYNVKYDANGGSGAPTSTATLTITGTKTLTVSNGSGTSRTGYALQGWSTNKTATTPTYKPSSTFTLDSTTISAAVSKGNNTYEIILYAIWKANSYTVSFNANGGGSGGMIGQTQSMTYDSALPALSNTAVPTRTGYTFAGFFKEAACTTQYYKVQNNAVVAVNTAQKWDIANNATLYAKWNPNTDTPYTITHLLQNVEDGNYTQHSVVNSSGTTGASVAVSSVKLSLPGFTCETPDSTTYTIKDDGTLAITLKYSRNTHDVTFAYSGTVPTGAPAAPANQTSVKYGATVTVPDVRPTDFGYHVDWQNDASVNNSGTFTMPDQQVNFTGTWSGNQYYVFFYDTADANKPSAIQTLTYGKQDTLTHTATRNGYEFLGWSTEPGQGGTKFDKDKAYTHNLTTTENDYVIVYGMWKGGSFVVKYDGNGAAAGAPGSDWPTTGDLGGRVTLPTNDATSGFSRPGYTFAGWSTEAGAVTAQFAGGASVQLDDYVTTEGDAKSVTLYAVWGAQINVDTTISPVIQLKVQDGKVTDAPAITAENIFASKTPANVLVSSIKCEPVEGENGTAKVFSEKDRWRLVKLQLSANGNFDEFAIDKDANAHKYTTDSSDKFIIPAAGAQDGTLPLGIKLVVPEQVTANVIDGEADVAKLLFTFQIA